MKPRNTVWTRSAIVSLSALFLGLNLGLAAPPSTLGSTEQRVFPADLAHGKIRCVLMSVGQTTVFPIDTDNHQYLQAQVWRDGKLGVPCLTITFLVEALGGAPYDTQALKKLEVYSSGRLLPLAGGTHLESFGYEAFPPFLGFSKPKVSDPKRAVIRRFVWFGSIPDLEPLSLNLQVGFDQNIEAFEFAGIRLK